MAPESDPTQALRNQLAIAQAQVSGAASLLLDVQQDCIAAEKRCAELRARLEEWERVLGSYWDATKAEPSAPQQVLANFNRALNAHR